MDESAVILSKLETREKNLRTSTEEAVEDSVDQVKMNHTSVNTIACYFSVLSPSKHMLCHRRFFEEKNSPNIGHILIFSQNSKIKWI